MSKRAARIHLDATEPGSRAALSLCGMLAVETTQTAEGVTCKTCRRMVKRGGAVKRTDARPATGAEIHDILASAFTAGDLRPTAPPPPVLDPAAWSGVCRFPDPRCGACLVCQWEAIAARFDAAAPWIRVHRLTRPEAAPQWSSMTAALVALAEYETQGRWAPSALGPMLEQLERAAGGGGGSGGGGAREDRMMRKASELSAIDQALDRAYGDGDNAALIEPDQARDLLLARTPGARVEVPTYEQLAPVLKASAKQLKATVKHGRRIVTIELAARGLIPDPRGAAGLAEAIEHRRATLAGRRGDA